MYKVDKPVIHNTGRKLFCPHQDKPQLCIKLPKSGEQKKDALK